MARYSSYYVRRTDWIDNTNYHDINFYIMDKLKTIEEVSEYVDTHPDILIKGLANLAPDSFVGLLFKFFLIWHNEKFSNKLNNGTYRNK